MVRIVWSGGFIPAWLRLVRGFHFCGKMGRKQQPGHLLRVAQINTGGGCHLDAPMIRTALPHLDLSSLRLLMVENVGNLVCPANFKLGTHANVVVASAPEGHDKPYKYPGMFAAADVVLLNKADLCP
ncbi:MAG: hydrogenase accessory protein HypB, partial [Clostridia bacterium]|nr:hydrogenase accessory protein HypB [Clostridia bacterium]